MRSPGSYRIIDEPRPSWLARWAVNPFWVFLASLLSGTALGFLWFTFNAWALGSAFRVRESAIAALGISAGVVFWAGAAVLHSQQILAPQWIPYLELLLIAGQLTLIYWLHFSQERSFELFEYYGGSSKSGAYVLLVLIVVKAPLREWLGPYGVLLR